MNILEAALKKIETTSVSTHKRVALAYSGGVDSSLCIELLRRVYNVEEIIAITIDVGQGMQEMENQVRIAKTLNITPLIIDAKQEFSDEWLSKAIQANSNYNGYPVSTSMTRQLIAKKIALKAVELGCDALMEGSTGKGNDQYRMHNVFSYFAPTLDILVPVRDFNFSRSEELALCELWNVPVHEQIVGGDDKTLWCRSIASGAIDLNQVIPDDTWMWLKPGKNADDEPVDIALSFKNGIPTHLNNTAHSLVEIVETLNTLGGQHGIGLIDMIEDGIMGLKSHEVYEAPAAKIILTMKHDLEQLCLTKEEIQFKKGVDNMWAYLVYHGMWHHPLKEALDAFINKTQQLVEGTYTLRLYKGTVTIIERASVSSLFFPEIRSITSTKFNQTWCKDAAKIIGMPFEMLALRETKNGVHHV
jgi:argininosuccinate synthase